MVKEDSNEEQNDGTLSGAETEKVASDAREKNLLARDRGRSGTVSSGFLGFLDEDNNEQRKTLLGE
ncbi:MAG: hypothetical protein ACRBDL_05275 [Alphaproteobacteria bacterium]